MSIERLVNYFRGTDLSGNDIVKLIGKPPVLYSDLKNYKTLNQLLGRESYVVLLYQTSSKTTGHFVCCFIRAGTIHFQDSYSFKYDTEQQYTPYDEPLPRYLTQLIESDGRPVVWNKHDYQAKSSSVATCGRWSCLRILLKSISDMDFQHLFYTNKDAFLTSDNLVVMLTLVGLNNINEFFEKN
jgi:hypothetical protein